MTDFEYDQLREIVLEAATSPGYVQCPRCLGSGHISTTIGRISLSRTCYICYGRQKITEAKYEDVMIQHPEKMFGP